MTTLETITTPEKTVKRPRKPRPSDPLLDLELLTLDEGAQAIRTSRWTFAKLRRTGVVPTLKIGSKEFCRRSDLKAMIDAAAEAAQATRRAR